MDYFRPRAYPSPPDQFTACDYLAGVLLVIALIVMLVVLAAREAVVAVASMSKGASR